MGDFRLNIRNNWAAYDPADGQSGQNRELPAVEKPHVDDIEALMDKLDSILSPEATIERSNELNRKIGAILSERDRKIRKMPPEEKRASVLDTTDEETLNCWAQEENFALRILALSNPHISPGILHQTVLNVGASDLYTLHIVANNPSAASETLALIADFGCNNNEIKYDLLRHPNSGTLLKLRLSEGSEAGQ